MVKKIRNKLLVIIDLSPELKVALRYGGLRAKSTRCGLILLSIVDEGTPQQWKTVENIMQDEAKKESKKILAEHSSFVKEVSGITPETKIVTGNSEEAILKLLKNDKSIRMVVLAASEEKNNPGPLINLLVNNTKLPIPAVIVPGHLNETEIEEIAHSQIYKMK